MMRALRLLLIPLCLAMLLTACAKPNPLVGKWEEAGQVTEFRADGKLIAADGTESRWKARMDQPASGTLSLLYGDLTMDFSYVVTGDQLTLKPVALAGQTELTAEVGEPIVMTRVK
jgi:hypothetical protein